MFNAVSTPVSRMFIALNICMALNSCIQFTFFENYLEKNKQGEQPMRKMISLLLILTLGIGQLLGCGTNQRVDMEEEKGSISLSAAE